MAESVGRAQPEPVRDGPVGQSTLDALIGSMPFAASLGMGLTAASATEVRGMLPWRATLCSVDGILHGGVVMAFADSLGGICAFLNLDPHESTSTIESKTNFFRAFRHGQLLGVSVPLHVGRSTIVVQTDLFDAETRHVARVTQTQSRLGALRG